MKVAKKRHMKSKIKRDHNPTRKSSHDLNQFGGDTSVSNSRGPEAVLENTLSAKNNLNS